MFKCKLCGAVEINSTALELHIAEIHLSFQPWQCMYCSNKGSTMEQIKSHCLLTHKLNSPKMTYSYDPAKSENLRRLLETSLIESAVNEATKKFDPKLFSTKMDEFQSINAMIANLPLQTPEILEISAGKNQDFGSCSSSSIDTSLPFKCPASITFKDNDLTSARTRPYHSVRVARPYLYSIRRASEPASDTDATTSSTSSRKRPHEEEDNDEMTKLEIKDGNVLVDVSSNKWRCKRCCLNLKAKDIRVHIHMHLYKQEQLPCLMCSCEGCDFGHFLKTTLTSHVTECHGHLGYFEPTPNISEEFFEKAQEMMELCFGKVPFKFSELSGWETSTTPTGGNFPCRFCNNSFPKNVFYSHAYYHLLSTEKIECYACSFKNCDFKHNLRKAVLAHIEKEHNHIEQGRIADVKCIITQETEQKVKRMVDRCFGLSLLSSINKEAVLDDLRQRINPSDKIIPKREDQPSTSKMEIEKACEIEQNLTFERLFEYQNREIKMEQMEEDE